MKKHLTTLKTFTLILLGTLISQNTYAGLPAKVLVGYWHNWEELKIREVDPRYNVIMLSFLEADKNGVSTDNKVQDLEFDVHWTSNQNEVKSDIALMQAKGKSVLMSIGGGNGSFKLNSAAEKDVFVSKVKGVIQTYGVDGIDIDLENKVYLCMNSGTIANPEKHIQLIIDGIREIRDWYSQTYGKKMLLTMAPETHYVQGGLSQYATCAGGYLPIIEALRKDIDLLMVQLYNSGSVFDLNQTPRTQGDPTFIVSMTEAVIRGFTAEKGLGNFSGISSNKVVVALPASSCAAGSGYVSPTDMKAAMKYLMGTGLKVGSYTLKKSSGYSDLRGLMTWSINNDLKTCGGSTAYQFADAAEDILGSAALSSGQLENSSAFSVFPNPTEGHVTVNRSKGETTVIQISNSSGAVVLNVAATGKVVNLNISKLSKGLYFVTVDGVSQKIIKN